MHQTIPIPQSPERRRSDLETTGITGHDAVPDPDDVEGAVPVVDLFREFMQQEVAVGLDLDVSQCFLEHRVVRCREGARVAGVAADVIEDGLARHVRGGGLGRLGHVALEGVDADEEGVAVVDSFRILMIIALAGLLSWIRWGLSGHVLARDQHVRDPEFVSCGIAAEACDGRQLCLPTEAADALHSEVLKSLDAVGFPGNTVTIEVIGIFKRDDVAVEDRLDQAIPLGSDRATGGLHVRKKMNVLSTERAVVKDFDLKHRPAERFKRVEVSRLPGEPTELRDRVRPDLASIVPVAGRAALRVEDRTKPVFLLQNPLVFDLSLKIGSHLAKILAQAGKLFARFQLQHPFRHLSLQGRTKTEGQGHSDDGVCQDLHRSLLRKYWPLLLSEGRCRVHTTALTVHGFLRSLHVECVFIRLYLR